MVVAAGSLLLGGLFIRFYDLLHQAVAHDVLLCQANLRDALDVPQDMQGINEAAVHLIRQVDLGHVAGDHNLAADAMRVRNIFICSGVVFWASSRMMKASSSVRPRI